MPRHPQKRRIARKSYGPISEICTRIGRAKPTNLAHAKRLCKELGEEAANVRARSSGDIVWEDGWFDEPYLRAQKAFREGRTQSVLTNLHQAARMVEGAASRIRE